MPRPLANFSVNQLLKLADTVKEPFSRRDEKWRNRRKVRYRQMEQELSDMPLSQRAGKNKALMVFQTEEPNQDVHRRTKRLIANKPRIQVIIYDSREEKKQQAQEIKDALKALYRWMNKGKVPPERKVVEYQQGDGVGFFKLDYVPDYADKELAYCDPDDILAEPSDDDDPNLVRVREEFHAVRERFLAEVPGDEEGADERAYNEVSNSALRRVDPPFRLSAPDPLALTWTMDGDQIDVIVERGKRKLSTLLETYKDHRLRLVEDHGVQKLVVWPENTDPVVGETIPESEELGADYSNTVEYIEIRTRLEIIILIRHPQLMKGRTRKVKGEDDYIRLAFDNPFAPYSTGYVMVPGDVTGSHDPADEYQPSILGMLSVAQPVNVLSTIRISAAIDAALASKYVEVEDAEPPAQVEQSRSDKTPTVKDGRIVPTIPGRVRREEAANVDLDKAEAYLAALQGIYRFQDVLGGDATSADSGHKLAIQVSQADTQIVPYQTSRAEATAELLMACLYAVKNFDQKVFVRELPDPANAWMLMNRTDDVQSVRALTPEMFDLDFNLVVSIGSETPVTKFAKWSALEARYKAGTLSYETLMEQSDVENVADEIARVFEGQTLVAVMQQSIPVIVKMIANRTLMKLSGGAGPQGGGGEAGIVNPGGNEGGGGMPGAQQSTPIAGVGRVPGVGMSPAGPTTGEYGPRVNEGAGDGQAGEGTV